MLNELKLEDVKISAYFTIIEDLSIILCRICAGLIMFNVIRIWMRKDKGEQNFNSNLNVIFICGAYLFVTVSRLLSL